MDADDLEDFEKTIRRGQNRSIKAQLLTEDDDSDDDDENATAQKH